MKRFSSLSAVRPRLLPFAVAALATLALTPLAASATGPETDTATLHYTGAGFSCSFTSPDEGSAPCTAQTVNIGAGCLGLVQLVRDGWIALTEPSGESVSLSLSVVGTNGGGVFNGGGSDAGAGATAAGSYDTSCKGDMTTGITVTLSWTVA